MEIERIKKGLVNSCLKKDASLFLPYLEKKCVTTTFPDKKKFYSFFEFMINEKLSNSEGELRLVTSKIDFSDIEDRIKDCYEFYDEVHKFSRLSIFIYETENSIELDVSPL